MLKRLFNKSSPATNPAQNAATLKTSDQPAAPNTGEQAKGSDAISASVNKNNNSGAPSNTAASSSTVGGDNSNNNVTGSRSSGLNDPTASSSSNKSKESKGISLFSTSTKKSNASAGVSNLSTTTTAGAASILSATLLKECVNEMISRRDGTLILSGGNKFDLLTIEALESAFAEDLNLDDIVRNINLDKNRLRSLYQLRSMPSLRKISARENELVHVCGDIHKNLWPCRFESLTVLDLSYNLLVELPDFSALPKLKTLLLQHNKLSKRALAELGETGGSNIEILDISQNPFGWNDVAEFAHQSSFFSKLRKLKKLAISPENIKDYHIYLIYHFRSGSNYGGLHPITEIDEIPITKQLHARASKLVLPEYDADAVRAAAAAGNNDETSSQSIFVTPNFVRDDSAFTLTHQKSLLGYSRSRSSIQEYSRSGSNISRNIPVLPTISDLDFLVDRAQANPAIALQNVDELLKQVNIMVSYCLEDRSLARLIFEPYPEPTTDRSIEEQMRSYMERSLDQFTQNTIALAEQNVELLPKILLAVTGLARISYGGISAACVSLLKDLATKERFVNEVLSAIESRLFPNLDENSTDILSSISDLAKEIDNYKFLYALVPKMCDWINKLSGANKLDIRPLAISDKSLSLEGGLELSPKSGISSNDNAGNTLARRANRVSDQLLDIVAIASRYDLSARKMDSAGLSVFIADSLESLSARQKLSSKRYIYLLEICENICRFTCDSSSEVSELTSPNINKPAKASAQIESSTPSQGDKSQPPKVRVFLPGEEGSKQIIQQQKNQITGGNPAQSALKRTIPPVIEVSLVKDRKITGSEYFVMRNVHNDILKDLGSMVISSSQLPGESIYVVSRAISCLSGMMESRVGLEAVVGQSRNKFLDHLLTLIRTSKCHPLVLTAAFQAIASLIGPAKRDWFPVKTQGSSGTQSESNKLSNSDKYVSWKSVFRDVTIGLDGVVPLLLYLGENGSKYHDACSLLVPSDANEDENDQIDLSFEDGNVDDDAFQQRLISPRMAELTSTIMHDLLVSVIDIIRLYCFEANRSYRAVELASIEQSAGKHTKLRRNKIAEDVASNLNKAGREAVLFECLNAPSDKVRLAVVRCLVEVPLSEIDSGEVSHLVSMLSEVSYISSGQNEDMIIGSLRLLSKLCVAEGLPSAAGFRTFHGETAINATLKILKFNEQRDLSGESKEMLSKIVLSKDCVHFLIASSAFPSLQPYFASESASEKFRSVLRFEDARARGLSPTTAESPRHGDTVGEEDDEEEEKIADPLLIRSESMPDKLSQIMISPTFLEWTQCGYYADLLVSVILQTRFDGPVAPRILRQLADVLMGVSYEFRDNYLLVSSIAALNENIEKGTSFSFSSRSRDNSIQDGQKKAKLDVSLENVMEDEESYESEDDDDFSEESNDAVENEDDGAESEEEKQDVGVNDTAPADIDPRNSKLKALHNQETSITGLVNSKLMSQKKYSAWLRDIFEDMSVPLISVDEDYTTLAQKMSDRERDMAPYWIMEEWELDSYFSQHHPEQILNHKKMMSSQLLDKILLYVADNFFPNAQQIALRLAYNGRSKDQFLDPNIDDDEDEDENDIIAVGNEESKSDSGKDSRQSRFSVIEKRKDLQGLFNDVFMGIYHPTSDNPNNNKSGSLGSTSPLRDTSLIPLRQIFPSALEVDQIYISMDPDAPSKELATDKSESLCAFLRVVFSLIRFGNSSTRANAIAYFRNPEKLMLLSMCCMGTRTNPMYFRSSVGAKFFAICAEICSSEKYPWYSPPSDDESEEEKENKYNGESKMMIKIFDIVCKAASRALCSIRQRLHEHRRTSHGDDSLALFASKCLSIITTQIERLPINILRKSLTIFKIKNLDQLGLVDIQNEMWKSLIPLTLTSSVLAFIMFDMDRGRNDKMWLAGTEKKLSPTAIQNLKDISSIVDLTRENLLTFCASCVRTCSGYRYQILEEFVRSDVIDRFPVRPAFVREMLALVAKGSYSDDVYKYLLHPDSLLPKPVAEKLKSVEPVYNMGFFGWCVAARPKPMIEDKAKVELTLTEAGVAIPAGTNNDSSNPYEDAANRILLCEWVEVYSSIGGFLGQKLFVMTNKNYYLYKRYYESSYPSLEINPRNFGVAYDNQVLFETEINKDGYMLQVWKYDYETPTIERVCIGPGQNERIHILLNHDNGNLSEKKENMIETITLLTKGRRCSQRIADTFFSLMKRAGWRVETDTSLNSSTIAYMLMNSTNVSKKKAHDVHMISDVLINSSTNQKEFTRQTMVITDLEFLLFQTDYNKWDFKMVDNAKVHGDIALSISTLSPVFKLTSRFDLRDLAKITFEGFDLPSVVIGFDTKPNVMIASSVVTSSNSASSAISAIPSSLVEYTIFLQDDLAREQMRKIILYYGRGLMRRY